MIRYALSCAKGHSFESWFQSGEAYDKLHRAGMVACAVCGGTEVSKSVMAPRVATAREAAQRHPEPAPDTARGDSTSGPLSAPASPAEQALAELRKKVEENSDYVGDRFADEARRMHLGEAPERSIWGEARLEEAKALAEDGVPVAPLPFMPSRKSN